MPKTYTLAFYEIDRAFGGREEGGWWYDTGQKVRDFKRIHVDTEEEAYVICRRVNSLLRTLNNPRYSVYSMVYNGGQYSCCMYRGNSAPKSYPKVRPYYG
jgi:hypothetical protein